MSPPPDPATTGTSAPDVPPGGPAPRRSGSPSRWWGIGGGAFAAAVALAVVVWTSQGADQRIEATTIGYKVVDDRSVTVGFDVSRPPGQPVTCTVTAQDVRFTTVGSVQVVIATTGERTTHREVTVRTASRAVTGNVTDCVRTR